MRVIYEIEMFIRDRLQTIEKTELNVVVTSTKYCVMG